MEGGSGLARPLPEEPAAAGLPARARLVVRAFALLDLAVTGCLAVPPLARALFAALAPLERALGGAGMPAGLPGVAWLFVSITGVLGVLWAIVRLGRPTRWLGWADAAGRAWVGLLILHAVVVGAAPRAFLLFVLSEWSGTLAQAAVLWRRPLHPAVRR